MPGFYATVARFYDAENADKVDDLVLYSELAAEYGDPVLDIGCGTGRVMLHLAQEGYRAHGIDSEAAMLERAKLKLDSLPDIRHRVSFYLGDALTYALDERFKLVIVPYNGLMHFRDQDAQFALLRRLRQWIDPAGLLVLDLPNAGETFATQDTEALTLERMFIEPDSGHLVMQQAVSVLDRVEQLMRVTWIYDEITGDGSIKRTIAPILFRYYFYPEVRLLLGQTGFAAHDVYGDVDGSPFEDGCPRMIVLARPV